MSITAIQWRGLADPLVKHAQQVEWSDLPDWLAALAVGVTCKAEAKCYSLVTLVEADVGRRRTNIASVGAVSLDFDAGPPPWEALAGYAYVAYTSPSHTTAAPRWRVHIRLASPVPASDYPDVAMGVIEALGRPEVDTGASCDPARLWFSPTEEADLEVGHGIPWPTTGHEGHVKRTPAPKGSKAAPVAHTWPVADVARHVAKVWAEGTKHPTARAVGGYLARRGWDDDAIAGVIAEQDSDEPHKRQAYALAAAERAREGQPAPGWDDLAGAFGAVWADGLAGLAKHPAEPPDWHLSGRPWSDWWARNAARLEARLEEGRARSAVQRGASLDIHISPEDAKQHTLLVKALIAAELVSFDERQRAPIRRADGALWADADLRKVRIDLSARGIEIGQEPLYQAIMAAADADCYDPVRRYLEGLPAWDGTRRSVLVDYFGAEPGVWADACWRVLSVSAVARAFEPGCKVDTMVILEGAQGIRKSSGLRALCAAPRWFSDTILHLDDAKVVAEGLTGVWIQEVAELSGLRGRDAERIKASLSSGVDRARAAYGRFAEAVPRRSVFVGTVNPDGSERLTDTTGARRFLPVRVTRVRVEALEADRDQIWAEAVARYRAGGSEGMWWLAEGEESDVHAEVTETHTEQDPWRDTIEAWLRAKGHKSVAVGDCLAQVQVDAANRTQQNANRMARILRQLGWVKVRRRVGEGRMTYRYEPTI